MEQPRRILVTSALPYANGAMHLGYILESIQTDIWVRFQRMMGNECYYVCGEDSHGTPIMLQAEKENISPEELIAKIKVAHENDLQDFLISLDNFYTTHSPENQELSSLIYQRLSENGDISKKTITQAFDQEKNMFLPDRYVKGTCPRCKTEDQYGDNCEKCGATYLPTDLIDPKSVISGTTPIEKQSEHYFFGLPNYHNMLTTWMQHGHLQEEVVNKLGEWFEAGLQSWDISRDKPYFGFNIPGTDDKYFYVWLDAPIGYMASFKNFAEKNPHINFDEFWTEGHNTELYHFIGKDIIYFHALFWPAMLTGAKFRTPTAIFAHGFITVNGQKMSKSRGTFIKARTYLDHLHPEYLRYYFAAKLNSKIQDIDINFEDFKQRINSDLVGKIVNLASRSQGFIKKTGGLLASELLDIECFQQFVDKGDEIAECYENREFSKVVRLIIELADIANQYIDQEKPWVLNKEESNKDKVIAICTQCLNLFRVLIAYLKPILPEMATNSETFLNCEPLTWQNYKTPLLNHTINKFTPLMQRIEDEQIQAMLEQSQHEKN